MSYVVLVSQRDFGDNIVDVQPHGPFQTEEKALAFAGKVQEKLMQASFEKPIPASVEVKEVKAQRVELAISFAEEGLS